MKLNTGMRASGGRNTSVSSARCSLSRQNTSHSLFRVHRNIKSIKILGLHLN